MTYRVRLGCTAYARMNTSADQARRMMYIGETMMENTFTHAEQNNQQLWDELAPIHVKSYQEINMLKER